MSTNSSERISLEDLIIDQTYNIPDKHTDDCQIPNCFYKSVNLFEKEKYYNPDTKKIY